MKMRGFSLIELIIVIVVLGVLSVGIAQYISLGAQVYSEGSERDEVVAQSRFMLTRMAKELRQATPNSIRLSCSGGSCASVQCLEFVPFQTSTIVTNNVPLDVTAPGPLRVVKALAPVAQNDQVVIYPLDASDVFDPAHNKRRTISATPTSLTTHTEQWDMNLGFAQSSPSKRVYVLADSPVSFCVEGTQLYRYQGYGFQVMQQTPNAAHEIAGVTGQLVGQYINNNLLLTPTFSYSAASLTRNALVNINFELALTTLDEINLNHEIHIPNVP